jgi:hypothetical protein
MKDFKRVMTDLALNMHFEEAQKIKRKLKFWRTTSPFYDCQPENYQYRRVFNRIR